MDDGQPGCGSGDGFRARCSLGHSALRAAWHPGRTTLATKWELPDVLIPVPHRMVLRGVHRLGGWEGPWA